MTVWDVVKPAWTVTGQKGTWSVISGDTVMTVVLVPVEPPATVQTDVTIGGNWIVVVWPRGYGGRMILQGGIHCTTGVPEPSQMSGG
jgi:hypothetical protein